MALRLAFMGTPDFAVPVLLALQQAGHEIVAVYSQPPRPSGRRGRLLSASPVQSTAEKLRLPTFTPSSLREVHVQNHFAELKLDAAVVVAYGQLLPPAILAAPKWGCYNAHASLLPRWRGAAPIQRAIMAGDRETGVMIMKMDEGLDSGPIAMTHKMTLTTAMNAGVVHDVLASAAAQLMVQTMASLQQGTLVLKNQGQEGITYAHKITKQETRIDWHQSAGDICAMIRGLSPFPGAWCEMKIAGHYERVKLLDATMISFEDTPGQVFKDAPRGYFNAQDLSMVCEGGIVRLTRLQKAGGKVLYAQEFQHGHDVIALR